MDQLEESLFEEALNRYKAGSPAEDLIKDFQKIVSSTPNNAAGWTCLSWLQLLLITFFSSPNMDHHRNQYPKMIQSWMVEWFA